MATMSPWDTIHRERGALAADLAGLADTQWQTPSLCGGWNVEQVLAHMTAAADTNPGKWFVKFAGSGFRFNSMVNKDIAAISSGGPQQTLARFKAVQDSNGHPPGPVDSWLGETLVHAEDIRRPLGIAHDYPLDAVTRVADFYSKSNLLIGSKKRASGLTMRATDIEWSSGSGPEVSGPAVAIVLAMTGRAPALAELQGEGVDTLRSRM
jgi:uncharacterized protein (TIGR03083 family)